MERISAQGNDYYYFYGPNGKVLAEFTLTLVAGSNYVSNLSFDSIYFGGMLLGTTQLYAGTQYSSIVDRLGTGHPGYAYGTDIGTKTGSGLLDFATYLNDSMTGFKYANQRWYSAGMGRMLSIDQDGSSAHVGLPGTWNRFAYSSNDPIDLADPSGNGTICLGSPSDYDGAHCYDNPYDASEPTTSGPDISGPNSIGGQLGVNFPAPLPSLDNLFTPPDPPAQPSPAAPEWDLDVGYTPTVNAGGHKNSYDHLFIWTHPMGDNNPADGFVFDGGPAGDCSKFACGAVIAWHSNTGHYGELTNPGAVQFFETQVWGSIVGNLIQDESVIDRSVGRAYNPFKGPNSNSVVYTELSAVGIAVPIFLANLVFLGNVGVLNYQVGGQTQIFTGWGQNLLP